MDKVAWMWRCLDSPPLTTLPSGSELVPLEGLRVLGALHGNEAETQKLPGPHQGHLSLLPTSLTPWYDCRALRGCAQRRASVSLLCLAHRGSLLCHSLTAPCLQGGRGGEWSNKGETEAQGLSYPVEDFWPWSWGVRFLGCSRTWKGGIKRLMPVYGRGCREGRVPSGGGSSVKVWSRRASTTKSSSHARGSPRHTRAPQPKVGILGLLPDSRKRSVGSRQITREVCPSRGGSLPLPFLSASYQARTCWAVPKPSHPGWRLGCWG